MNRKPTAAAPLAVYSVRQVWRGIWEVKWSDLLNYPRHHFTRYWQPSSGEWAGQWVTGEAHPTGCHHNGLTRAAPLAIASALDTAAA